MNYRKPQDVLSPRDAVNSISVLYDGGEGSISVAKIKWYDKEVMGVRWNVAMREWDDPNKINGKECLGMPTSTGHPVWFILPNEFLTRNQSFGRTWDKN